MRYTLSSRPTRFQILSVIAKRFFPERESVQEPYDYSLLELAAHRCVGFTPLPRRDDAMKHRY